MNAPCHSVLHDLKAVSRCRHSAVESKADILRRLTSISGMRGLLLRFYAFYLPAEEVLAPWLDDVPELEFARRRKCGHLRRDLGRLGIGEDELAAIEPCAVASPASLPEALGYAYVMEGATLGGLVVREHAGRAAPPMGELTFFGCYGAETARLWHEFCCVIEARCSDRAGSGAAVRGATAAYAGIDACLA